MANNIKQLKSKIKSVKSLQKITKAMEMISRSKMKKAVKAALLTRSYATLALELLVNISTDTFHKNIYLKHGSKGNRFLFVYISSDKGLCGGYNAQVFKVVSKYMEEHKRIASHLDFITIGKYANLQARKFNGRIIGSFEMKKDCNSFLDASQIYKLVLSEYATGEYSRVMVVYTNFLSIFSRQPVIKELLPLSRRSLKNMIEHLGSSDDDVALHSLKHKEFQRYIYEPSADYVLDKIIPELVSVQIYQSILESKASEESSRMIAMKSASDNGEKVGQALELEYNRARQAAITKEIIEVSAGAEVLN